ncbi:MAG: RagB/SusD family nutrient uptake outer membrane protein [Lewinella sp.]|nr:RagB/SusD family nutrient uptake outer membrane protein [Lewinella sp.]
MKLLNIFLVLLGLMAFAACSEDFLDAEPITQVTDVNFYKTPADAYAGMVGCYDGMQRASGGIGGLSYQTATEVMSDNCFGGVGNADGFGFQAVDEFDVNRSPGDQNLLENLWTAYYAGIYRCNVFLGKVDQIDWNGQEDLRDTYESEVRVIRAHLCFNMVRMWGNIPLLTEPSTENLPQANPDEVYAVIAQDLIFAAEHMKQEPYTSVESGRITAWAAKSLLARVYLYYTGYYGKSDLVGMLTGAQALQHLEDVIANSGHGLVDDFASLWPAASLDNYAGETNEEIVFSVRFTFTSDYNGNTDGNHWMVMYGMREFTYYPYATGWGVTVNPALYDTYAAGDTRRDASIIGVDEEGIPFDKIPNQREYTGYYVKKYTPMSTEDGTSVVTPLGGTDFQIGQFQDFIVMRYADVLLMAAELGSANAQDYFDMVRERAYQDNFSPLAVSQQAIMKERQLEFPFESLRIWDLLRQGLSTAGTALAQNTTLLNGGVEVNKVISPSNVELTQGLQQIPNNQITLSNGVLQQNAGW